MKKLLSIFTITLIAAMLLTNCNKEEPIPYKGEKSPGVAQELETLSEEHSIITKELNSLDDNSIL